MEKTPLFKNLRRLDKRIEHSKTHNVDGAGVDVPNLHEAEELMRAVIARNTYDAIHMEWMWDKALNRNMFVVTVFWDNKEEEKEHIDDPIYD